VAGMRSSRVCCTDVMAHRCSFEPMSRSRFEPTFFHDTCTILHDALRPQPSAMRFSASVRSKATDGGTYASWSSKSGVGTLSAAALSLTRLATTRSKQCAATCCSQRSSSLSLDGAIAGEEMRASQATPSHERTNERREPRQREERAKNPQARGERRSSGA